MNQAPKGLGREGIGRKSYLKFAARKRRELRSMLKRYDGLSKLQNSYLHLQPDTVQDQNSPLQQDEPDALDHADGGVDLSQDIEVSDEHDMQDEAMGGDEQSEAAVQDLADMLDGIRLDSIPVELEVTDWFSRGTFAEKLREWLLTNNIPYSSMDKLLPLLRAETQHKGLPKTTRTFLKTPRKPIDVVEVSSMKVVYYSIKTELRYQLRKFSNPETVDYLLIATCVDGVPLKKASAESCWPVMCSIINLAAPVVFCIGYAFGRYPSDNNFLDPIIDEMNNIQRSGLIYKGKCYLVLFRVWTLDNPAKSKVMGTKGHSGYNSCIYCRHPGKVTVVKGRKGCRYPVGKIYRKRTHDEFLKKNNTSHYVAETPLRRLEGFNMPRDTVVDVLHVLYLGVVRKIVTHLFLSGKTTPNTLSAAHRKVASQRNVALGKHLGLFFQRKPRTFQDSKHFKGVELRTLVIYTGKCCFNGLLSEAGLINFLYLSLSVIIYTSEKLVRKFLDFAHECMVKFLMGAERLYSTAFMTPVCHQAYHLRETAEAYGSVEKVSTFRFENHAGALKRKVRSGKSIPSQVHNRRTEYRKYIRFEKEPGRQGPQRYTSKQPNNIFMSLEKCVAYEILSQNSADCFTVKVIPLTPYKKGDLDMSIGGVFYEDKRKNRSLTNLQRSELDKAPQSVCLEDFHAKKLIYQVLVHELDRDL